MWRSHFQQSGGPPGEEGPPGLLSRPQLKPGRELESISERIISPYETEARYGDKGNAKWTGYRVHLSQTCDEECPHLITHTMTTPAPRHDFRCTEEIHRGLCRKGLPPREHVVDRAYLSAEALIESHRRYGIELVGPMMPNSSWQNRQKDGYGAEAFTVDWERKQVRCPQGKTSAAWGEYENARMGRFVRIRFAAEDCHACSVRARCTRAVKWGR